MHKCITFCVCIAFNLVMFNLTSLVLTTHSFVQKVVTRLILLRAQIRSHLKSDHLKMTSELHFVYVTVCFLILLFIYLVVVIIIVIIVIN